MFVRKEASGSYCGSPKPEPMPCWALCNLHAHTFCDTRADHSCKQCQTALCQPEWYLNKHVQYIQKDKQANWPHNHWWYDSNVMVHNVQWCGIIWKMHSESWFRNSQSLVWGGNLGQTPMIIWSFRMDIIIYIAVVCNGSWHKMWFTVHVDMHMTQSDQ